jgi:hypothetical protein
MSDGKRGSKPLGLRDWIFGSAPRRALLHVVLVDPAPDDGWTKADLARAVGLSPKGGVDEHVAGLASLGLLASDAGRWRPQRRSGLARALRGVLAELDRL